MSHPGPAGSLVWRRVDSRLQPVDSDSRNSDPQPMSVSVFRRPWQAAGETAGAGDAPEAGACAGVSIGFAGAGFFDAKS